MGDSDCRWEQIRLISPGASEFVKWLTKTGTTGGKRFVLALVAILGAISFSALTGTPLNVDSVSSLVQVAFEALAAFLAAHGSYSLVTGSPSQRSPVVPTMHAVFYL
jgi:hypothetical protein